tara:strand:+ start:88 stop:435 length:348 start_codon:yes stop_codon:yes gene_type:complete
MWHSLKKNGDINFYDVRWSSGVIETDIPTMMLEKVKDSDAVDEKLHEKHGVDMHEEGSDISERKYKKKKKTKKKKKKKHSLYPYVFGYGSGDNDFTGEFGDFGGGSGDGGGGGGE